MTLIALPQLGLCLKGHYRSSTGLMCLGANRGDAIHRGQDKCHVKQFWETETDEE